MPTMQKIECTACNYQAYTLTDYRAISIAAKHETLTGYDVHKCSISAVPFKEELIFSLSNVR